MPIGYVEITLVDGNFTLLESFAETVTVLTADCITEAFRFIGSEGFGKVTIDLAVKLSPPLMSEHFKFSTPSAFLVVCLGFLLPEWV